MQDDLGRRFEPTAYEAELMQFAEEKGRMRARPRWRAWLRRWVGWG